VRELESIANIKLKKLSTLPRENKFRFNDKKIANNVDDIKKRRKEKVWKYI